MTAEDGTAATAGGDADADYHEVILLDEPTTADLRAKVTEAWREFAHALAAALPALPPGANLEITLDPAASGTGDAVYAVSVQAGDEGRVSALAVGNATLPRAYWMDRATVAHLVALGWSPPGVVEGSGDSFGLRAHLADAPRLASTLSRTLRDVYGAPHPAFLVYLGHDANGVPISVPPLGTARGDATGSDLEARTAALAEAGRAVESAADSAMALDERVRTVVATLLKSTPEQLQVDSDGDIGIRAGSAMVFVRVRDNPPLVDVFSPVLTEVRPTEQLYVRLSELTNRMPIGRLYCTDDTVWASVPVFGRNFQAPHLMLAIQVMTGLADELDDRLHGEFGGRRFFGEGDKPVHQDGSDHRTGMYL